MGYHQLISFLAEKLDCRLVHNGSDHRYWLQMLNKSIGEVWIGWTEQAGWHVRGIEYYYDVETLNRNIREFNADQEVDPILENPEILAYEEQESWIQENEIDF